jgi:hypothetical protein
VIHRLRTTWIIDHLRMGTPIDVIRDGAGLRSIESLDRYMRFLDPQPWDVQRELLRGTPKVLDRGAHIHRLPHPPES